MKHSTMLIIALAIAVSAYSGVIAAGIALDKLNARIAVLEKAARP